MNIYVGNLPQNVTEDAVRQLFEEFGDVSEVKLIKDKYSGEFRGFGFVDMSSKDEADAAIKGLNGSSMGGKTLTVNEARPRTDRPKGRGPRGGGGGRGPGNGFGGGYRGGQRGTGHRR